MRYNRLPLRCKWDLRLSGMLCRVDWYFLKLKGHVADGTEATQPWRLIVQPYEEDDEVIFCFSILMEHRWHEIDREKTGLVVSYRRSGQPIGLIFKGQAVRTAWPLKMGPIGCPETSVTNYKSTLRNMPKERRPHGTWHSFRVGNVVESNINHLIYGGSGVIMYGVLEMHRL
jgi:hypothetical protein